MKTIRILGTGCRRCAQLQAQTEQAVKKLGIDAQIEKIEDITEIAKFGVFMTPAIAVDGEVKAQGRVPSVDELAKLVGEA